ncbi:hypothetical protein [Mycobacterium sp.]|uniref:hypothetical protein n=1 Tax=Mycobacterium sp. TaxID=1785 RepID=UPI002B88432A|nr:hypothetical protein [Mycobacterium sp.]HKP44924.1 hypothetical protein [Mycobacterium sp.]
MTGPDDANGDEIRAAAAAALADCDALGAEGEDRSIILKHVLQVRLPIRGSDATLGAVPALVQRQPGTPHPVDLDDGDVLGKIAAALKLDRDVLELVYAVKDGEPELVLAARRLASNKAQAARQLAQLISVARQAAGLEEWTSTAPIRKVVTDYGKLDSGNFAATIQQMDKVAVLRGKGQSREVKITRPGMEATADLIKSLVGNEA